MRPSILLGAIFAVVLPVWIGGVAWAPVLHIALPVVIIGAVALTFGEVKRFRRHVKLGEAFLAAGDTRQAAQCFRPRWYLAESFRTQLAYQLALVRFTEGRIDEALNALEELPPGSGRGAPTVLRGVPALIAICEALRGELAEARLKLEPIARGRDSDPYALGVAVEVVVCCREGKFGRARELYRDTVGQTGFAPRAVEQLTRACWAFALARRERDEAEAKEVLVRALPLPSGFAVLLARQWPELLEFLIAQVPEGNLFREVQLFEEEPPPPTRRRPAKRRARKRKQTDESVSTTRLFPIIRGLLFIVVLAPFALQVLSSVGSISSWFRGGARWQSNGELTLIDVNGDQRPELLGRMRRTRADEITLTALDGQTGEPLWETKPLGSYGDTYGHPLTFSDDLVLASTSSGTVFGFRLTDGTTSIERRLDEVVVRFCRASSGELVAITADRKQHVILPDDAAEDAPRDGSSCEALPDEKSLRVGFDAHALRENEARPKVRGMSVAGVIQTASATVAIGERNPGSPVPVVARVDEGQPRWLKSVASDPLTADRGAPALVAANEDAVFALYETTTDDRVRLVRLNLDSGAHAWELEFDSDRPVAWFSVLAATSTHVYAAGVFGVEAFDGRTGERAFHVD